MTGQSSESNDHQSIAGTLLSIERLRVTFQGNDMPAVRDVSLRIAKGEVVALVGESGSGKSVTAKAAMRLIEFGMFYPFRSF